jgi:poly-beta-hydroxyalkanoate depolymerase
MKTHFPINFILLFFSLPLVCLSVLIVGYFSYHAYIEIVTALSREQQLFRAEAIRPNQQNFPIRKTKVSMQAFLSQMRFQRVFTEIFHLG